MENFLAILWVFGIFSGIICGSFLIGYIIFKITDKTYDRKHERRKAEHPKFFDMTERLEERVADCIKWNNTTISPKKREIDNILKELDYLPKEQRREAEERMEKLRCEIYTANIIKKDMEAEIAVLREHIHEYVAEHDLKWAKNWGW